MRIRKSIGVALAAFAMSISGASSASAASWDYLGHSFFHWSSTSGSWLTKKVESKGGWFKICAQYGPKGTYTVWESDPNNTDDWVGSWTLSDGKCASFSVQNSVDGDNARAELYVENRGDAGADDVNIEFYD